jgi:hypothetical protein
MLPERLLAFRKAPGMYLVEPSLEKAIALMVGYDMALHGSLSFGLREWLVPRHSNANSIGWPWLLRMEIEARMNDAQQTSPNPGSSEVEMLFVVLEEFLNERSGPWGPRAIFDRYEKWLGRQTWYGPGSPHWLPL